MSKEDKDYMVNLADAIILQSLEVYIDDLREKGQLAENEVFAVFNGVEKWDRFSYGFILDPKSAATIITELFSQTDRFGIELIQELKVHLSTVEEEGNPNLIALQTALDLMPKKRVY